MLKVVVDGSNVTQALKLLSAPEIESFLQRLEGVAAYRDWQVWVIFDGPERFVRREAGPLVVQYAPKGSSADAVIERLVYKSPDRSIMVVVTEDRALGNLVFGLGARVMSPQGLLQELTSHT